MSKRNKFQFETTDELHEKLKQSLISHGLNPDRDKSKFIRALIKNSDVPFFKPQQLEELHSQFSDLARVGGLLNQVAYHLNSEHLQVLNGEKQHSTVQAKHLEMVLSNVEVEVKKLLKSIIDLANERRFD